MIRSAAILGLVFVSGAAHAQPPAQPSEVLLGLGGYCWEADLREGVTDTHCFSVARGGHLVMDVHKVRNRGGGVVYEGATLYRSEPATGMVRYDYYNSNGDLMSGYAQRDGARIRFPSAPGQAGDLVWYLDADAYEVGTAAETAAKTKFVKIGPAPEGGF